MVDEEVGGVVRITLKVILGGMKVGSSVGEAVECRDDMSVGLLVGI